MSRSGYTDDGDTVQLWRRAVDAAVAGKRGQAFLREMLAALDALPNKRLISGELVCDGECCALGAVALKRGTDVGGLDSEDSWELGDTFGIARSMAAEIMYMNDERYDEHTPEERFVAIRRWVAKKIAVQPGELVSFEDES
jgi:hypothetical protein